MTLDTTGRPNAADPPARSQVDPAQVGILLEGGVQNLLATWDQERALFPFASRLENRRISNTYDDPIAVRYTINSILGLARAAKAGVAGVSEEQVAQIAADFETTAAARVRLPADHGLMTLLRAEAGASRDVLDHAVEALDRLLRDTPASSLNIQDLAWILWGAAGARRAGAARAADVVRRAADIIDEAFVHTETGLPRHSTHRYRRNLVSFGSLVYFLRAMHEADATLDSERARNLFASGVQHALGVQGPRGEWPWLMRCDTRSVVDAYPVFAVHQDSMAMLFLHPAIDRGLPGTEAAQARSLAWDFGCNERELTMFVSDPFFAYRSIERVERFPRIRRYGRSLLPWQRRGAAVWGAPAAHTRLNDECRSYHLGWVLYVWSGRLGTSA